MVDKDFPAIAVRWNAGWDGSLA